MESNQIKEILEKYWAGSSSIQEEELLRRAIHQPEASEELKSLRMIFTAPIGAAKLSETAEAKMEDFFKGLQQAEGGASAKEAIVKPLGGAKVKQLPVRNWLKVAVVALLLIGIGGVWTNKIAEQEKIAAKVTYEQTKQALAMMGLHFKTGEETTINSIIDAGDNLDILN